MPKTFWPSARGCSRHSRAQRMVRSTASAQLLGGRVVRRAFVEHHRDVRAEHALDFHGFLRPEKQQRAVQVRTELDAVLLDLADFREAENLEAAAVGQNRPVPIHELVQPAGGADDVEAGPDVQVIGVAENDLRAHLAEFARVERLDAALRADGHEHRRLDDAVRGGQSAQARFGVRIGFEQFKHRAQGKSKAARLKVKISSLQTKHYKLAWPKNYYGKP